MVQHWYFFCQILAFLAHLVPCPNNKQCKKNNLHRWLFHYMGTNTFTCSCKKLGFLVKFGPTLLAKYLHTIWSHGWPKSDANKVSRWFSVMWVPKLLLPPVKIMNFGLNNAFVVIMGQILAHLIHLVPFPSNITMGTRCLQQCKPGT